ncbi:hypothetical protein RW1_062_00160 [Rhodococcus wratislaviensis NBRC 100605]|uniref:Uncharacterized protein n=1 Tax=Rhodococcus wratislaviensis NBRC 100605 TaxID=1219028 RepID=X0QBA5_RHOWR|nr:hypothetical protein RW1_062_00160 [Rhodococcus wratislaviensis NBRC 100605]
MSDNHDNSLHELPLEFVQSIANSGGGCDGQAIIPTDGGTYICWCSCGEWTYEAVTSDEGLHAARRHTGSVVAMA